MFTELTRKKLTITGIKNDIVISRPKQMYGWPGIVKVSENEILVAASERCYHCCPYGREVIVRSTDGGQNWSLPQEVYNSELDDRDANLNIMPDGTLILSWFTSTAFEERWLERARRVSSLMRRELLGSWMCCSKDFGDTWETPLRMPVGVHISPSVLSDGSLITVGDAPEAGDEAALTVYKSRDLGKNWTVAGKISCGMGKGRLLLNENHVLETSPGRLIGMFRSDPGGDGYLYQSISEDYGETWTAPHKTAIWGYPPQLLRLHNGVIMCSYSYRRRPYSIRAVFSHDDGLTWDTDNIQTIYEWDDEPDMGYPGSIELSPGNILTIFYCSRRDIGAVENKPEGILSAAFTLDNY